MTDAEDLAVGARIKALRAKRRWSARQLAEEWERVGSDTPDRSAVSKLENGTRKLKADEAVRLAQIFGVTTDYLLTGVSGDEETARQGQARTSSLPASPEGAGHAGLPALGEVRRPEVDHIMSSLESGRGAQGILVIGPPGMGKSMLVSQLIREAASSSGTSWATRLLDVRSLEPEIRTDAIALIARMFDLDENVQADEQPVVEGATYRAIAQRISKAGKPLLCVLDSADELTDGTSARLRSALNAVYSQVQQTGRPDLRLAFVVASRLEDSWLGLRQEPVFDVRPLPEFDSDTIKAQLRLIAEREHRSFSMSDFATMASVVHRVSAGLPALLSPIVSWVEDDEWLDIQWLENANVAGPLITPYIEDLLIAPQSLFPRTVHVPRDRLTVVRSAISLLVRYRIFTRSHVKHHLDNDASFKEELKRANWELDDLWQVLSGMALLKRPDDDLPQKFHPAIRKLLFRHYYPSPDRRAAAHWEALAYTAKWAVEQPGKERVVGRVEELWHTASALRLEEAPDLRERLLAAARETGTGLDMTGAYSLSDLSAFAARHIEHDAEFQGAIADTVLAADLKSTVLAWA